MASAGIGGLDGSRLLIVGGTKIRSSRCVRRAVFKRTF